MESRRQESCAGEGGLEAKEGKGGRQIYPGQTSVPGREVPSHRGRPTPSISQFQSIRVSPRSPGAQQASSSETW